MTEHEKTPSAPRRKRRRLYEDPEVDGPAPPRPQATPVTRNAPFPRSREVDAIIRTSAVKAAALGLFRLPFVSTLGGSAIDLGMIESLARAHGVPFSRGQAKALLVSLAAGSAVEIVSRGVTIFGLAGLAFQPILAGATTYVVGTTFARHFAAGGTLADFEASSALRQAGYTVGHPEPASQPENLVNPA